MTPATEKKSSLRKFKFIFWCFENFSLEKQIKQFFISCLIYRKFLWPPPDAFDSNLTFNLFRGGRKLEEFLANWRRRQTSNKFLFSIIKWQIFLTTPFSPLLCLIARQLDNKFDTFSETSDDNDDDGKLVGVSNFVAGNLRYFQLKKILLEFYFGPRE